MLGKFCVFCGEKPKGKNKEHIIPYWLLELTGKPSRSVKLGFDWRHPKLRQRRFGYSSFTFPACEACNTEFSDLEGKAKQIIVPMLAGQPVSAVHLDTLLDWLDKVRIGLWLGFIFLNGNFLGLKPQFYIKQRMAARDRLLYLYRDADPAQGVAFAGVDSPIFHLMPSCMLLIINQLHLFSASSGFLFSPRMGLPREVWDQVEEDGGGEYFTKIVAGTEAVELPLTPYEARPGCTQFFQPIIPKEALAAGGENFAPYDNDYVKQRCMDFAKGKGKVFQLKDGALAEYPAAPSMDWQPATVALKDELMRELPLVLATWQEKLMADFSPPIDKWPEEKRTFALEGRSKCLALHRKMVDIDKAANRIRE
jgi:hypothetical protein